MSGLITMTPTSVDVTGSATINADGGVDLTSVTSVSLNGVFTSDYLAYKIVCKHAAASGAEDLRMRLRLSGSDAAGASTYYRQSVQVNTTSWSGTRQNLDYMVVSYNSGSQVDGFTLDIWGPAVADETIGRASEAGGHNGAFVYENTIAHTVTTAYDGFTLYLPTYTIARGNVHVFGYEE